MRLFIILAFFFVAPAAAQSLIEGTVESLGESDLSAPPCRLPMPHRTGGGVLLPIPGTDDHVAQPGEAEAIPYPFSDLPSLLDATKLETIITPIDGDTAE